ncbi:MAG: hypothetical protein ACLTS1_12725 [Coprococcus sp.]
MMAKLRVVHYINQFFAQHRRRGKRLIIQPELRVGEIVGPGMAF